MKRSRVVGVMVKKKNNRDFKVRRKQIFSGPAVLAMLFLSRQQQSEQTEERVKRSTSSLLEDGVFIRTVFVWKSIPPTPLHHLPHKGSNQFSSLPVFSMQHTHAHISRAPGL